jgi:hypothetical protein
MEPQDIAPLSGEGNEELADKVTELIQAMNIVTGDKLVPRHKIERLVEQDLTTMQELAKAVEALQDRVNQLIEREV